jgi:hypothetical protein
LAWKKLQDYIFHCYLCFPDVSEPTSKNIRCIIYPNLPSAFILLPHSEEYPLPETLVMGFKDNAEVYPDNREMDEDYMDHDIKYVTKFRKPPSSHPN